MQVNIDTIKTSAFAIRHRLLGYKLLKNPTGTPKNEVNMIKTWFGVIGLHNDKCHHYERIRRHKEGDKFVKDKTLLISEYFIDPDTKTFSGKRKNITGYIEKSGDCKSLKKTYMTHEEYDKRPLPKWDDYDSVWGFSKDEYALRKELYNQNKDEYYLKRPGLLKRIFSLGLNNYKYMCALDTSKEFEPSFWEVLKSNLKG